jgi:hypothetical protein
MKKIRALQQFSHFHAGTFDQHEVRPVSDETAEALVGMKLAKYVEIEEEPEKKAEGETKAKEKAPKK